MQLTFFEVECFRFHKAPPNKALVWTAQAALFCCGCCIEVGLAGQVGEKSNCVCWRRDVLYSPLLLIGGVFVAAHSLNVGRLMYLYTKP